MPNTVEKETLEVNPKVKNKKKKSITVKANKKGRHTMLFLNLFRILIVPFYYILKPFKVYGNRNVKDGACIFVCNHYSLFDPVYAAITTWEGIHFLAKREAFDIPIVGRFLYKVKAISVNRDGNDVRGVLDAIKCLKNNEKICIYPEGTRNKTDGEMAPFRHGASVLAIKTRTPIIPIVIYNRPRYFRRTHILVGEPLELSEYYDKKQTNEELERIDNSLRQCMIEMRTSHTEFLTNKKKKKA